MNPVLSLSVYCYPRLFVGDKAVKIPIYGQTLVKTKPIANARDKAFRTAILIFLNLQRPQINLYTYIIFIFFELASPNKLFPDAQETDSSEWVRRVLKMVSIS